MRTLDRSNPWAGAPILHCERTVSTMAEALALGRRGCPTGTTVVADFQEAGRGRLGPRRWSSEAGKNLLFTQVLRGLLPEAPQRLPLLVGLAVARTLESLYALEPVIKWPNDVMCQVPAWDSEAGGSHRYAKVAGVLCEAVSEGGAVTVLAGVGLNCNQLRFRDQPRAVSLAGLLGREVDRFSLLESLLAAIQGALTDSGWKAALLKRLLYRGREVTVHLGPAGAGAASRALRGVLEGLEDDGAMRIRPFGGEAVSVYSGELEAEG